MWFRLHGNLKQPACLNLPSAILASATPLFPRFSPGIFIFKNILEFDPKNTFLNLEEMEVLALKILLKYSKGILCPIKPELK